MSAGIGMGDSLLHQKPKGTVIVKLLGLEHSAVAMRSISTKTKVSDYYEFGECGSQGANRLLDNSVRL